MFRLGALAIIACAAMIAQSSLAAPAASPAGLWLTASHNAVVQIEACGQNLCGRIAGLVRAEGAPAPTDWQGASQCGLTIIQTTQDPNSAAPQWTGSILDPRNGALYHARLTLGQNGNLKLRGYVGIPLFGETQSWTRYTGTIGPQCQVPPQNGTT